MSLRVHRIVTIALAAWIATAALAALHAPAASAAASSRLTVRITGLPAGQRPAATLRGPGVRRRLRRHTLTLSHARAGRYRLSLTRVRIVRPSGAIRRGAVASPIRKSVTARLRRGHHSALVGDYGTIVNPGVRSLHATVLSVRGAPGNPTSIRVKGKSTLRRGSIVSIRPGRQLPRGLLSRVVATSFKAGTTQLRLRAASISEVAPAMSFDVPLTVRARAKTSSAGCGGVSGMSPYRRIRNISFSGGWNTQRVLAHDIDVGIRALAHFDVEAGLDVTAGVGISCKATASVSASGMAGPVPVTAAIEGDLTAFAGVGGKLSTGGSLHVDAGASTIGTPPALIWLPEVSFSDPRFTFSASAFAQASAGIGIGVKAGLGNDALASATVKVGASADLSAQRGSCSWDATFGRFSAEGKLLGWTVESPKTPALFTKNLWHAGCGASTRPPPPISSTPTPTAPPTAPVRTVRLTPLDATQGPGGFQATVSIPPCPSDLLVESGTLRYGVKLAPGMLEAAIMTQIVDASLAPGSHPYTVTCRDAALRPVWRATNIVLTTTSAATPVLLKSTSVPVGGQVVFRSGASGGPAPCPTWPGHQLTHLVMAAYVPGNYDATHAEAGVALPDGADHETLTLQAGTPPGRYLVTQYCSYSSGARAENLDLANAWITVTG